MLKSTPWELYKRLLRTLSPYKAQVGLVLASLLVAAVTEPLLPILLKYLVDDTLIAKNPNMAFWIPIMVTLVFCLKGLAEYVSKVASSWVAHKAILDIRALMFRKIVELPLQAQHDYSGGNLLSKVTYNVPQVANSLGDAWIIVIRDVMIIVGLLGYLTYLSWKLTLLTLLIAPLVGFIIDRASRLMRQSSTDMQNSMGIMTQQLEECLGGIRDIKIYGAQEKEKKRLFQTAEELRRHTMSVIRVAAANVPLVQILAAIALSIVIFVATTLSQQGSLSPGEFVAFITAMALVFEPIRRLTSVNQSIQQGLAAAESIFELIDQPDEPNPGKERLTSLTGEIKLEQLSFQYPRGDTKVLSDLTLTIPAGKTTALVGQSGSGKTTLVNLIARFYSPTQGRLTIDGTSLESLDLAHWREQVAFVSQNVVLFNDTIRANIAFGNLPDDENLLIQAAKDAHAWEFIQNLPNGLDTIIGDNGALLSGGQRQRLAIARAFLKNAPILVFDEATSSLDNQSEAMIQQAMERLRLNRTVIIIAHRLSTIENADQIVVMDQGRRVELGSHATLMTARGVYFNLYQRGALASKSSENSSHSTASSQ